MINKFWILALSLMVGGALTACGQDTAGGQAAVPAETAVEAVSASMDELSTEETAAEETAAEEATEKTPAEESSAEGTSMGGASIDGRTADETSLEGISGEAAQTDGTAVESAASVISAGTETAAAEVYTSREEAYKALLASLDPDEWEGAALIDFGGKQEPSLFVAGSKSGSLLVFYDQGSLQVYELGERYPTWLEAERLLCDSALEGRRHYDRIYSIGETSLTEISGGSYGMTEDGTGWTYIWDGMEMKREGYREAMDFIFDISRAVSFEENDMRPLEEWIGLWTQEAPDGDTSSAAAVQGDTSAAAETGVTAAAEAGETAANAGDDAGEN
ncbi:MAG: hypothetical protein UIB39_08440 [Lachnospiraceae bacterium]|nr:hypothetical protein [Lachnospiraceae bacterium]